MGCRGLCNCRRLRAIVCGRSFHSIIAGEVFKLLWSAQTRGTHGDHIALDHDGRNARARAERVQVFLAEDGQSSAAMMLRHNMSIDTDPQQHEAASPQVLVVRSSLR